MNAPSEQENPSAGSSAEGQCIRVEANAGAGYATIEASGKQFDEWSSQTHFAHSPRPPECRQETDNCRFNALTTTAIYRDPTGRAWKYRGKRARVLELLVSARNGVTQLDTLPWNTRLGGTIYAMRMHGLVIETVREGKYRRARYLLRTPGSLSMQDSQDADPAFAAGEMP